MILIWICCKFCYLGTSISLSYHLVHILLYLRCHQKCLFLFNKSPSYSQNLLLCWHRLQVFVQGKSKVSDVVWGDSCEFLPPLHRWAQLSCPSETGIPCCPWAVCVTQQSTMRKGDPPQCPHVSPVSPISGAIIYCFPGPLEVKGNCSYFTLLQAPKKSYENEHMQHDYEVKSLLDSKPLAFVYGRTWDDMSICFELKHAL